MPSSKSARLISSRTNVRMEHAVIPAVIASEREAIQLMTIASWIASHSLAMTPML